MKNDKIDFVVTWVDGNDPKWKSEKEKHFFNINKTLNSDARFRDWDIFKYWFRAVEKYAPWVNKIFLITEGHIPDWLNLEHPKLIHIKHSDYIDSQYLPTFNSNVIELNILNIKDLSDKFVLFNDDTFINSKVTAEDFFTNNGLPKDLGIFSPIVPKFGGIASTVLNNLEIINKYFNQREILKKNFKKFFNLYYGKHLIKNLCTLPWKPVLGYYDAHLPVSYDKNYFNKVCELEKEQFNKTFETKFREKTNVNHWLIRYWQLSEGFFSPRNINFGRYYDISDELFNILLDIRNSKHKLICLNDGNDLPNFDSAKENLIKEFEKKYNIKSLFEK